MGLRQFWQRNKVLIVMFPSLGLIHWGWYALNANPVLQSEKNESMPERMLNRVLNSLSSLTTTASAPPAVPAAPASAESK